MITRCAVSAPHLPHHRRVMPQTRRTGDFAGVLHYGPVTLIPFSAPIRSSSPRRRDQQVHRSYLNRPAKCQVTAVCPNFGTAHGFKVRWARR